MRRDALCRRHQNRSEVATNGVEQRQRAWGERLGSLPRPPWERRREQRDSAVDVGEGAGDWGGKGAVRRVVGSRAKGHGAEEGSKKFAKQRSSEDQGVGCARWFVRGFMMTVLMVEVSGIAASGRTRCLCRLVVLRGIVGNVKERKIFREGFQVSEPGEEKISVLEVIMDWESNKEDSGERLTAEGRHGVGWVIPTDDVGAEDDAT